MAEWERVQVAIVVKAYPTISTRYQETVCVAAVRTDQLMRADWVRLFPVLFRQLPRGQQFKKWDIVEVEVQRHAGDQRPESMRPNIDSVRHVRHLDTARNWADRRAVIDYMPRYSMCELRARQQQDGTSLGLVVPGEVLDLTATVRPPDELAETRRWAASQPTLFDDPENQFELVESIPVQFRYKFRCNDSTCRTHEMSIIDWELGQAFRSWKARYGDEEIVGRIRQKWLNEMCAPDRDTMFFAGNMHQHPGSFLVLGCWWPRR